ncbi:MAG: carbohydrate ABC transporter permease [Clostridia bacterium]|nr:carbohydrate ABC transporter permease [Clostridia bacterium]
MAVIQNIELKSRKGKWLLRFIYLFLVVGAIIQFFPLTWLFLGTFKTNAELISAVPSLLPAKWSIDAYIEAFSKYKIWENLYNTFFVCAFIIIAQTFTSTLAAFSFSKVRPKSGNFIYMMFLGTQMFSTTALLFPTYIMMSKMGMIGSKWSWVLCSSAWAYAIVLYKSFFDSIPKDLIEASEIDGAGTFRQITNIIMPLSKPIYSVCILNTFMAVYNDFLFPLMLLPDEKDWTLMIRIYSMSNTGDIPDNVKYVLLFVTCLPSIIFYLFAQKNIQQGISTAGLKG